MISVSLPGMKNELNYSQDSRIIGALTGMKHHPIARKFTDINVRTCSSQLRDPPARLQSEPCDVKSMRAGINARSDRQEVARMKQWQCMVCGFIYDEAMGMPGDGIPPGTPWGDIPDDWMCPDCGVSKEDFEMIEI